MSNHRAEPVTGSWIFVHSSLDDAGLDPESFRILAHLARRAGRDGSAFPKIESIAATCGLHPTTVKRRLDLLVAGKWITRTSRAGFTNAYTLAATPPPPPSPDELPHAITPLTPIQQPPHAVGGEPPHRVGDEGNPPKEIQKGDPKPAPPAPARFDPATIDLPFKSDAFRASWREWCKHLKEKRKPLKESAALKQLRKLQEWGEERAIAAIDTSIAGNWQGIYEKNENKGGPNGRYPSIADRDRDRTGLHSTAGASVRTL